MTDAGSDRVVLFLADIHPVRTSITPRSLFHRLTSKLAASRPNPILRPVRDDRCGQRSDTDVPLLAGRRSVRSASGRTISRRDLSVERHVSKNYKVRHRKIDAESCNDRDKLCDKYIAVLRKDNKGGGRK